MVQSGSGHKSGPEGHPRVMRINQYINELYFLASAAGLKSCKNLYRNAKKIH